MLHALCVILVFQLGGEAAARALGLPVPGPVLGAAALLIAFVALPRLAALVRPTGEGILAHLSLLFVPAGVGVVGHLNTLGAEALPVAAALIGSTVAAIAAGALTFAAVARMLGQPDEDAQDA
jgi:putative effector of murein hydrolase LrgA (UPF0299 family)